MVIGDDVVVTVLEVKGDVVRVGVQAPRAIRVHRAEVYAAVVEANRAAAASRGEAVDAELSKLAARKSARRRPGGRGPAPGRRAADGAATGRPAAGGPVGARREPDGATASGRETGGATASGRETGGAAAGRSGAGGAAAGGRETDGSAAGGRETGGAAADESQRAGDDGPRYRSVTHEPVQRQPSGQ